MIVWAAKRNEAEYRAKGRMMYVSAHARRATPADLRKDGGAGYDRPP